MLSRKITSSKRTVVVHQTTFLHSVCSLFLFLASGHLVLLEISAALYHEEMTTTEVTVSYKVASFPQ